MSIDLNKESLNDIDHHEGSENEVNNNNSFVQYSYNDIKDMNMETIKPEENENVRNVARHFNYTEEDEEAENQKDLNNSKAMLKLGSRKWNNFTSNSQNDVTISDLNTPKCQNQK